MANKTSLQLLPYLAPSQAQKHVTYNAAIQLLDVLVQTSAESRFLTSPPVAPVAGDSYIVGAGASGDWTGEDNSVAVYNGSFWDFYEPKTGWRVWVQGEGAEAVYDGTDWTTSADRPERVARLGIAADSDDTNRLALSSDASLFNNAGTGHQLKINKAGSANTASILFQTGFSGRAEMGTVGNDDFVLKVSPDGTTFLNGITIEAATGRLVAARGIKVSPVAGDPSAPENGDIWYNSTTGKLRIRQGGTTVDLVDLALGSEQLVNKGLPNGYAGLDSAGRVPATQLPSYVDDVLEFTNFAAFPDSGELGKIYVALDTNKTWRWSGSAYVEISPGPGNTDQLTEGSTNLYFTAPRTLGTALTGFVAAGSRTAITASDTVLTALQKTQKYHADLSAVAFGGSFADLTAKPTTIAGYGITDAVDLGSTQTISGTKTFSGTVTFSGPLTSVDSNFTVRDNADANKKARFELSGVTTGTTRVLTVPDLDGELVLSEEDFPTRAAFVAWAPGKTPSIGRVITAEGYRYRYIGSGTAISDLPGWVPDGTATAVHFGADLTGVVSAIPDVSALIDYVQAQGGGIAKLPAGTYHWPGSLQKEGLTNVILEGEGNRTRLVRQGNQTAAALRFYAGTNNRIRSMLLECGGYSGRGFVIQDRFTGIEDVECNNCPDRPFGMQGGGDTSWGIDSEGRTSDDGAFTTATFFPMGCWLEECRVTRAGNTAFSQKQMHHSRITRCVCQNVFSEGITIDKCDWSVVTGNTLLDVSKVSVTEFPDLDAGSGFLTAGGGGVGGVGIDGATGSRFAKNTIIGVNTDITVRNNRIKAAINLVNNIQASNGIQIEGNYFSDAKAGIWLKGTVSGASDNNYRHVITDNVFDTMGTGPGTSTAQFGAIWIDAGCTDNVISGNTQIGGATLITGGVSTNVIDATAAAVPWLTPPAGEYVLTTIGAGAAATTSAGAAGRIELFPFAPRTDHFATGLAINVTTGVAAALAKFVIYDSDQFSRPGSLVYESGDMNLATTGVKTVTISLTFRQNRTYWIGARHPSTATISVWNINATPDLNGGAPVASARKTPRRTLAYATPATTTWGWNSGEISNGLPPAIWLKV
ncbi:DUF2793 domain-containing protein [Stagnihabitans tardus]|uniref:DUF2793 domain-containing protein n=1 Tax=Stagnihabitans tardus TaxID=2699202 RepID=A0AAE5BVD9_9RHOB|nr:DUF2793 domain-containing protein [Stagnihabitans tardus]NBZ88132.1 DUF2793 domain-containing protein [Stagnihabitans tardus]